MNEITTWKHSHPKKYQWQLHELETEKWNSKPMERQTISRELSNNKRKRENNSSAKRSNCTCQNFMWWFALDYCLFTIHIKHNIWSHGLLSHISAQVRLCARHAARAASVNRRWNALMEAVPSTTCGGNRLKIRTKPNNDRVIQSLWVPSQRSWIWRLCIIRLARVQVRWATAGGKQREKPGCAKPHRILNKSPSMPMLRRNSNGAILCSRNAVSKERLNSHTFILQHI